MTKSIQFQDLPRVNEIAKILAKNGFGHIFERADLKMGFKNEEQGEKVMPRAQRLHKALVELGPTFVKFGQVLSVRPDILPDDILQEFETLQDNVPPMAFELVEELTAKEVGRPVSEVFTNFSEKPMGSASIAQVHRAHLQDGTEVAVKIQRQGIEPTIRSDLHILYSLAQLLEGRLTLPGIFTPIAIVQEFDRAITQELDFLQELRNAEKMGQFIGTDSDVVIPKVFPRWSTKRLLVMECINGTALSKNRKDLDAETGQKVARILMDSTYKQVFEYGFFHGDPHPGNILLLPSGKIAYVDFGIVGTLTGSMQEHLINAFTSLVFADPETLALTMYRSGCTHGRVDLRTLIEEIEKLMAKYHGTSLTNMNSRSTLMEMVEVGAKHRIGLPSEFAILSRALTLLEGEIRHLLPDADIVEEVKPFAKRLVAHRYAPNRVAQDVAKSFLQVQTHLKDLPTQFSQLMLDLERGEITITARNPDAEELRKEIRQAALRLSLAALASTTTLGALVLLAAWSPAPLDIPLGGLLGAGLFASGLTMFGLLGIHVFVAGALNFTAIKRRAAGVIHFFSRRKDEGQRS